MDKTMRAVLLGVGLLVGVWVVAHVPAYLDAWKSCGNPIDISDEVIEYKAREYLRQIQVAADSAQAAEIRSAVRDHWVNESKSVNPAVADCKARAWRVFFPR